MKKDICSLFLVLLLLSFPKVGLGANMVCSDTLDKLGEYTNIGVQWNSAYQYPKEGMNTAYYLIDGDIDSIHVEIPNCGSPFYSVISYSRILPNFDYPSYIAPENVTVGIQGNGSYMSACLSEFDSAYPYLMVSYYAAEGQPTIKAFRKDGVEEETRPLNILFFGNSFTQDAVNYAPFILKELYPDCRLNIGMCLIGGCRMVQHCANITNQNQTLLGEIYEPSDYAYFEYTDNAERWSDQSTVSVDDILNHMDWDVVTFQQNGYDNFRDYDVYYEPYVNKTFEALIARMEKPVKIGWLLTHGSYTTDKSVAYERWCGSMANSKRVLTESCAEVLFPYGTAIENLRTSDITTSYGECLLADVAHLQEGISTLTASYSVVLTLLDLMGVDNASVYNDNTRPTLEWLKSRNMSGMNFALPEIVEGITEENCSFAQECATQANRNPYAIIGEELGVQTVKIDRPTARPVYDLLGRQNGALKKGVNFVGDKKVLIRN